MDRMSIFIEENLNGYNLPADTLSEIRAVLLRRFGVRFSEGLSPEGRLAMEQAARREIESAKSTGRVRICTSSAKRDKNKQVKKDQNEKRTKSINFHESYDRSTNGRLDGDITDKNYSEMNLKKRAIGGKVENALETIEIMTYGEDNAKQNTDETEIKKRHSVEKCLVWMEVHNDTATPSVPGSAHSRNTLAAENDFEEL